MKTPNFEIFPETRSRPHYAVQKLWLKDFEHHINPATWQAAQELLQRGQVKGLREVEKHFWVALVETEDGNYETEMILTPNKIRAFTCECWTEGRRLMCAHVAAALVRVRQFLEQRAEERRARLEARENTELNRLTVQAVLENATPAEMLAFVREYARRDRDFALALKTWFAGGVTGAENPFGLVLDAVIPKNPAKPLREADLRRLRKTLDDLDDQLQAAAAERNFRTVFQIGSAVLLKTGPLLAKIPDETRRTALLHYTERALQQLTHPSDRALPPELFDVIWTTLLDVGQRGLVPRELERPLVAFLAGAAADDAKFEQLRAAFDRTPFPAPPLVLHLFVAALAQRALPDAAVRVLADYADRPAQVRDAIIELYYLHYGDAAARAGEIFLANRIFSPGHHRELEDLMLLLAEQRNDRPRQVELLRRRFLVSGHTDLYHRLRDAAGADWPTERERLLAELRGVPGHLRRLAAVLAEEGQTAELTVLLREHGTFEQVQDYEELLLATDPGFVREQYVETLSAYLRDHFGRPASIYVRDRLAHLLARNQTDLVVDIIRTLVERFDDRQSLPEELSELLPPAKRQEQWQ
jgi:hypothetical protein